MTDLRYLAGPDGVLAFTRGAGACYLNLSGEPVVLPGSAGVLLSSHQLNGRELAPDTAAWIRVE